MDHRLDLSPAQAPLNCCGLLPRATFSSKLLAKFRPRHFRKLVYQSRLHEGYADLLETRRLFGYMQQSLPLHVRHEFETTMSRLEAERSQFTSFSDFHSSHTAQHDALARADAFRNSAKRLLARASVEHRAWCASLAAQKGRKAPANARSPVTSKSYKTPGPRGLHPPGTPYPGRGRHASLADEPLQTVQTRAAPVTWAPSPPHNALDVELGPRVSPRPGVMTPVRSVRNSPVPNGAPWTPMSSLGLSPELARFSPVGARRGTFADSPSSYMSSSGSSSRSSGIRSTTDLPPIVESPPARSPMSVRYSDNRAYHHQSTAVQYRANHGRQQINSTTAHRATGTDYRRVQSPLRTSTVPEARYASARPMTFTP
ncbi:hypothetical protein OH77DRAFT_1421009 [Trametes cingulata]|nr:hypothetical protein OH77DRAFT_1421009 [Trametes cingulata]